MISFKLYACAVRGLHVMHSEFGMFTKASARVGGCASVQVLE